MYVFITWINIWLTQSISFFKEKIKDTYRYFKFEEYKEFKGYGLHCYVGLFGSGKTSSMVRDAYLYALKYKQLTILTNMKLQNFPKHTKIIEMDNYKQIIESPANTLILIDEISTVFNSRDWKKEGIPADLLEQLLQVRKQRKMMFCTAQRFKHVDALIRDITATVRVCRCYMERWNIVKTYDGEDFNNNYGNSLHKPICLHMKGFVQTDFMRTLYDTHEMVEKMKKQKYLGDTEILLKQGRKNLLVNS
jgi:hypothetical protein